MGSYQGQDGTTLFVEEAGPANAPVLVLVHGWSASSDWFRPQINALAEKYRVLVPDLRGHGRSRNAPVGASIDLLAQDLDCLLQEKGVQDCILLGWSMGAFVAFDYIRQFDGNRLSGLVIEDMTARVLCDDRWTFGLRGSFDQTANAATLQAIDANWPAFATAMMAGMFGSKGRNDPALSDWLSPLAQDNDPAHLAPLWTSMTDKDYRDLLADIPCPALILAGGESGTYSPDVSTWMAEQLCDAERILMEGCGHAPHLEDSTAFTAYLEYFAETTFAG